MKKSKLSIDLINEKIKENQFRVDSFRRMREIHKAPCPVPK